MMLKNKNVIIYGAGGAIGGTMAHTFAREGANLFLAGRTLAKLEAVAKEIAALEKTIFGRREGAAGDGRDRGGDRRRERPPAGAGPFFQV